MHVQTPQYYQQNAPGQQYGPPGSHQGGEQWQGAAWSGQPQSAPYQQGSPAYGAGPPAGQGEPAWRGGAQPQQGDPCRHLPGNSTHAPQSRRACCWRGCIEVAAVCCSAASLAGLAHRLLRRAHCRPAALAGLAQQKRDTGHLRRLHVSLQEAKAGRAPRRDSTQARRHRSSSSRLPARLGVSGWAHKIRARVAQKWARAHALKLWGCRSRLAHSAGRPPQRARRLRLRGMQR